MQAQVQGGGGGYGGGLLETHKIIHGMRAVGYKD